MASLYLQYANLPSWILTYFYYFQYRIAGFLHVSEVVRWKSCSPCSNKPSESR